MPAIPHVHRRGAVYYWRRRLPPEHGLGSHFVLSLRTTNQVFARQVAARLDEEMLRMFESQGAAGSDHRLTGEQIKGIFSEVGLERLAQLERVAAFDRLQPSFDIEESRNTDTAMGHVFRLLATHGPDVRMTNATIAELEAIGLGKAQIERIATYLIELRRNEMHIDKRVRLERLLSSVGAPATTVNLALAQTITHRAKAAALLNTSSRWDIAEGDDAMLLNALSRAAAAELPARRAHAPTEQAPQFVEAPLPPAPSIEKMPPAEGRSPKFSAKLHSSAPSGDPVAVAELLLNGAMKNVDEKSKRQVRSTARLLAKYLVQVHSIVDLRDLQQPHLAGFFEFLQTKLYVHYGKSETDEQCSIADLEQKWKTKPRGSLGVDKPTAARYAGHTKQMFRAARANGIAIDRDLTFEGLIANSERPDRARNARPITTVEQSRGLFHQPPFVGCKAWNELDEAGPHIFHCAIYFATLLFQYGGERREEICGALVDDVILDNGPVGYIFLEDNDYRRLKNPQSQRPVPIHPELIRLGFLAYVALIKSLGYELLFPDLYSPTTKSPLGDRYHDELRSVLNKAGITAKGTGTHSSRRGFGNNLKQQRVASEMRAELLGHGGDSETTERYCDHYEIGLLYEEILKLPNVTAHLDARPINLLPWVAAKQRPPFSHAGRTKEAKARRRAMDEA